MAAALAPAGSDADNGQLETLVSDADDGPPSEPVESLKLELSVSVFATRRCAGDASPHARAYACGIAAQLTPRLRSRCRRMVPRSLRIICRRVRSRRLR